MPRPNVWVKYHGLLGCCLATVEYDTDQRDEMPPQGDTLTCQCGNTMCFKEDFWEWDGEKPDKIWRQRPVPVREN